MTTETVQTVTAGDTLWLSNYWDKHIEHQELYISKEMAEESAASSILEILAEHGEEDLAESLKHLLPAEIINQALDVTAAWDAGVSVSSITLSR